MLEKIRINQTKIIDTIKLLIYKENPSLLEKVDFDDDDIFLEPLLFAYFNSKKDNLFPTTILEEILQGYFLKQEKVKINIKPIKDTIIYIPNLGYYDKDKVQVEKILKIDKFEIVKEIHPVLRPYFFESKDGHITHKTPKFNSSWKESCEQLTDAIKIIKIYLPFFYQKLILSNKKIYLHDNYKILNFTTVETLGFLYFYVFESNNLIYFIEELIHQGSHNFLYYVVHNKSDYFKVDVENLIMSDFTGSPHDNRTIYDAYHGLYTVTQRMENFDSLLSNNIFFGRQKHELLGRLADQFRRFETGLELLNTNEIYTELGESMFYEWSKKGRTIEDKYAKLKSYLNLSDLGIDFRYDDFCKLNPIEEFYRKEQQGIFNF